MQKVFISRNLKLDSIFKQLLENENFEVYGASLIEFKPVNFKIPNKPDWLFFYSKNGVRFFIEKVGLDYFKNVKIGVIGEGTATYLKTKNLIPDFIGTGEPKETAWQFSKVVKRSNVLFLRAKTSRKSVQSLLNDSIEIRDLVVYENVPKKNVEIGLFDLLVFTSPMNVEAYFEDRQIVDNQQVIAIGETTGKALKKLNIQNFIIAKQPSEMGLAEAILSNNDYDI